MNEPITENIKYTALQLLRETQAELTRINFLEVISLMSPNNPNIKEIYGYEESLNDITNKIGEFIQKNKNKVDFEVQEEPIEKEEEVPKEEIEDNSKNTKEEIPKDSNDDKKPKDKPNEKIEENVYVVDSSVSGL